MAQSNSKSTGLLLKTIIVAVVLAPLIGYGAINRFDEIIGQTFTSKNSAPAQSGIIRLGRSDEIKWRNQADSADLSLSVNASNQLNFEGQVIPSPTSGTFDDSGFYVYDNGDSTKKLAFEVSAITAGQTRTITMPDSNVDLSTVGNVSSSNTPNYVVKRDGSGNFSAGTITASLTGDVTGNLTGNVTGAVTGNASTATALAADPADCASNTYAIGISSAGALSCATVTNAGLAGSIAASKLIGTDIATVGTITSGTWNGTAVAIDHGGTGQTSANAALNALLPSQTGNTNKVLKTNGTDTSWATAGGGSGVNYAADLYDGSSVTGINQYADSGATPTDCTGGSPAGLTTGVETALGGGLRASSQAFDKDGSNRQGQGWSWDFTLDKADYEGGKPIFIQYRMKTSANYANNDVRMFVYDKDGATLLNVTSLSAADGSVAASSNSTLYTGLFYPNSSNNDYRICWHIAGTTASSWQVKMVDLKIGPDSPLPGAIAAETTSWTPTGSWSTNTTYTGRRWRFGDRVFLEYKIALSGAPTSATLTLNLPSDITIDTSKLAETTYANLGRGWAYDNGSASHPLIVFQNNGSTSQLLVQVHGAAGTYTNTSSVTQAVPFTFGNTDYIEVWVELPATGLSASAALTTTEAMLGSVKAIYALSSSTANSSFADNATEVVDFDTKVKDTHSAVTTGASWKFTAPKTAYYWVAARFLWNSGTNLVVSTLTIRKNGSNDKELARTYATSGNPSLEGTPYLIYLEKGEYIDIIGYHDDSASAARSVFTGDALRTYISISEEPDFTVFSTYGTFELLTTTSSTKTPSGSGHYHQLTGNSLTLTPGTWRLTASAIFRNSGSTPTYSDGLVGLYGANGADSSSEPAAVSSLSGVTVLSTGALRSYLKFPTDTSDLVGPSMIVRVTSSATVYAVTYSTQTTSANARVTAYANAERLQ